MNRKSDSSDLFKLILLHMYVFLLFFFKKYFLQRMYNKFILNEIILHMLFTLWFSDHR